jgi:hypothetical protein
MKMTDTILIRVDPKQINFINRIMEGHEYLGVVSTVNRDKGVLRIRITPDTDSEVRLILANLPIAFEYCEG